MDLPLPLDQFWFNLVLWVLITAYGASGIGNFMAFVPGSMKDDAKILGYSNRSNYSFWLISSLIFLLLGISQFRYTSLIYISIGEIYLIIIAYLYLIVRKWHYFKHNNEKIKQMKKRSKDEVIGKY